MKRELIIHKTLIYLFFGVAIISFISLYSLYVLGIDLSASNQRVINIHMIFYFFIVAILIFTFLLPLILMAEDNKSFYFNQPKSRTEIMMQRYMWTAFFVGSWILLYILILIGVTFVFKEVGLEHYSTFDSFMLDYKPNTFILLIIIFSSKIIFTIGYYKELIKHIGKGFSMMMIYTLTSIFIIYIMLILSDNLYRTDTNAEIFMVVLIGLSMIADYYIFLKGEI